MNKPMHSISTLTKPTLDGSAESWWLALAQANVREAREVQESLPISGSITAAQVFAAAQVANLRPAEAARLIGGAARLAELAEAVDVASRSGDRRAQASAQKSFEAAAGRVIVASRGIDSTTLSGRSGALVLQPSTTTVKGAGSEPNPAPGSPNTPARIASGLQADPEFLRAYPGAEVRLSSDNKAVLVKFNSQGTPRSMVIGAFRDLERLYPQAARQAGAFLTQRSSLYQGRTADFAATSFRMADMTSIVLNDIGDVIGTGTLTNQAAQYGRQVRQPNGDTTVEDLRSRQVLFLAQVAGELGGGRQAVDPLLAIARQSRTNVVATTFPVNFQDTLNAEGRVSKRALYGPADASMRDGGGTNPDFATLWRANGSYPQERPYSFGGGQGQATRPDGQSIFNGLPREPNAADAQEVRMHDRVFYGWVNEGSKHDPANIPMYVHSDHRLAGELPARDTSQGTRSYWTPVQQEIQRSPR